MQTLFISDLHLSPARPQKLDLFKRLLRGRARDAAGLYILGDLFDNFWVGNDDKTPPNPDILEELLNFSENNKNLFIIRGNRDLMLDTTFKNVAGCTLLSDLYVVELDGEKVLLSHGDIFCSKDISYQRYRRFMETGFTRNVFPRLPYSLRIKLSHGLRPLIRKSSIKKAKEIIDVDQATVEQSMIDNDAQHLIHGHTHRPDVHHFRLNEKEATRTVLSDWYVNDGVLVCENGERTMMRIEEYLSS
jgi:UDP-2,3-diacylglucosamine hydrolase